MKIQLLDNVPAQTGLLRFVHRPLRSQHSFDCSTAALQTFSAVQRLHTQALSWTSVVDPCRRHTAQHA
jgi:hypothetical protein